MTGVYSSTNQFPATPYRTKSAVNIAPGTSATSHPRPAAGHRAHQMCTQVLPPAASKPDIAQTCRRDRYTQPYSLGGGSDAAFWADFGCQSLATCSILLGWKSPDRVRGADGSCAKHSTVEIMTVVMLLTFILIISSIPLSVTHSLFHSRLRTFLFCKSFPP